MKADYAAVVSGESSFELYFSFEGTFHLRRCYTQETGNRNSVVYDILPDSVNSKPHNQALTHLLDKPRRTSVVSTRTAKAAILYRAFLERTNYA